MPIEYILIVIAAALLLATKTGQAILESMIVLTVGGGLVFVCLWAVGGDNFFQDEKIKIFISLLPVIAGIAAAIVSLYHLEKLLNKTPESRSKKLRLKDKEGDKKRPQISMPPDEGIDIDRLKSWDPIKDGPNLDIDIPSFETGDENKKDEKKKNNGQSLEKIKEYFKSKFMPDRSDQPRLEMGTVMNENAANFAQIIDIDTEKYNSAFKKYKGDYIVLGLIAIMFILMIIAVVSLLI